jgi:branched-chain amino acid transport system permease protein/urea transport system permease protein
VKALIVSELLITQLLNGIFEVAILLLVSFGLAIVMGLLRILNMAHGEFVALGAYCAYLVQGQSLPYFLAIPIAFIVCALVGYVMERTVIRFLYDRPFDSLLATWGIALAMREAFKLIFGRDYKSLRVPWGETVSVFGVTYPAYRLVVLGLIFAAAVILVAWYLNTRTANRVKAMISNPELARIVGIRTARLASVTFSVGVGSAGVAGVMIAPLVRVEPFMGFDYLLDSFFALVVGGMGSALGLLVGASLVGGLQSTVSHVANQSYGYFIVLIVCILFMWRRPNGIVVR